ncbi:hypothetical protein PIROE2DRAFT_13293 [Piromyces sp. E2]|nr:hypothetical protein PIROE2DRAFT_13293 [Piromyces sp. E2]|eukprot:OUM60851.1 hypothetical protein PIROE2DRAFT_13293 [Piromyces sp. E2]
MNLEILTKNKNKTIAISDLPTNITVKELCDKLYEFLGYYGNVTKIIYNDDDKDRNNCYAVVTFDNEYSVNNLRKSLETTPFNGVYLKINQEKTIQQIKPKCRYLKSNEFDSIVLEIANIPNELDEDDIRGIFEEHGDISYLDTTFTKYETITAYAYYDNNDVAKRIQKLMNGGKIEGHKIDIELSTPIPSCLCISNIDFTMIDIEGLINEINKFGEIKELEIYEAHHCIYINFKDINSAINLENEISQDLLYNFKGLKAEFCVPVANDYKIIFTEENRKNIVDMVDKKRYSDSKDESIVKKIKTTDETKEEMFESKPRKGNKKKYKGSQAFWGNSESSSSLETKKDESSSDTNNNDTKEYKQEDKKVDLKKEEKPKILNESKPINRIRITLSKRLIQFTTEICYKDVGLNMIIHYIDGDKDKPSQIFEKNKSIKFKKMKNNDKFIEQISDRLGRNDDPSWSFCIGCINDDGDYTEKIKSDFNNLKILNNSFMDNNNFLLYKENNTFVALLPSDYKYLDLFKQIFVRETIEEKQIMDALGKWQSPFFIFIIFDEKSKYQ